jgi:hypothetical protein
MTIKGFKQRLRILVSVVGVLSVLVSYGPILAQGEEDPGVAIGRPVPVNADLGVDQVEPRELSTVSGGSLSVYGSGFTSDCVVRLVGYGLLTTSFVNDAALKAQVPGGAAAGTYDVEVSDGDRTAALADAVTLVAPKPTPSPTPVPKPTSPPPAGRPILTIRNASVAPAQVRPGQEFVVTIAIYNNGSRAGENTLAIFPGGTFLPVGDRGHQLWQLHINHTAVVTQRMRVPDSLSGGVHHLQVDLSANDWEGNHFDYPQTVPVEVVGEQPVVFTGSPKLVIERAATTPARLVPGEPFTLTLVMANRGRRTAIGCFAKVDATDLVMPREGGDLVALPNVGLDEVVTATLPLELRTVSEGGKQSLLVSLEYEDYGGGSYGDQRTVGVTIDAGLDQRPQLIVSQSRTDPEMLGPGDAFSLTVQVDNVGGGLAHRLVLALGGEGGAALAPFVPLNAGNVAYLVELPAGERWTFTRPLMVAGDAESQAYNLPVALTYDDDKGRQVKDTQRLSLMVYQRPEVRVDFYREPDPMRVDQPSLVSLEVVNVGKGTLDVLGLEGGGTQVKVEEEGVPFVGPLDPGGSAPLDLSVQPLERGEVALIVTLRYRDAFNHPQVVSDTVALEVQDAPAAPGAPGAGLPGEGAQPGEAVMETTRSFWNRFLMGLLGLGS